MRTIASRSQSNAQELLLVDPNQSKHPLGKKVFCKIYIAIPHKQSPILYFMLDSGSDISLIHKSLISKLLSPTEIETFKGECSLVVQSFSNHAITLDYTISLPCKFSRQGTPIYLTFHVFSQESHFGILLGQDIMSQLAMSLTFPINKPRQPPLVKIHKPQEMNLHVIYMHPQDHNVCTATTKLDPFESKPITFQPHPISFLPKGSMTLISESTTSNVHIFPTRYPAFSVLNKPLLAYVTNLTNSTFEGTIRGRYESIDDIPVLTSAKEVRLLPDTNTLVCETLPIKNYSHPHNLKQITLLESIPSTSTGISPLTSFLIQTPFESTHHKVNRSTSELPIQPFSLSPPSFPISPADNFVHCSSDPASDLQNLPFELSSSNCTDSEPVPEDITLPKGYSAPAPMNNTIEDVVNVSSFALDHQKHIRKIFVKDYPQVLSLHAYDIGDLSASLGLYNIQLKDNETLPRFRKIYFLSQETRQHMEDILNFLVKYKVISRTNQEDKIAHLCASLAYLVGKPDKTAAYRLIIDFRLVNKTLLCPLPVIPDITSVLHTLQNQHFFSTMDLSSAFFSVKLHPD